MDNEKPALPLGPIYTAAYVAVADNRGVRKVPVVAIDARGRACVLTADGKCVKASMVSGFLFVFHDLGDWHARATKAVPKNNPYIG